MRPPKTHHAKAPSTIMRFYAWALLPFAVACVFTLGLFLTNVAVSSTPLRADIGGLLSGLTVGGIKVGNSTVDINDGTINVGVGGSTASQPPGCGSDNCTKALALDQIKFGTKVQTGLRSAILAWINFALGFLALIATAVLVFCGMKYVLAGANKDLADSAKKGVTYAVMGIVLIFTAYAIVATLINDGPRGGDLSPQPTASASLLETRP